MVQIDWTLLAKADLKNIFDYIAFDSKCYAKKIILEIKNETCILKSFPKVHNRALKKF
jgi:plasmid stabilization system protein ParE